MTNVGALIIVRHAFDSSLTSQTFVGVLAIATTFCAAQAYYNIKKLQLDQHRAWMLRTWFYGMLYNERTALDIVEHDALTDSID